jgi:hypothetical protein
MPIGKLRALRSDMTRWYDFSLKSIDTGHLSEAPVTYWVGASQGRIGEDCRCLRRDGRSPS